MKAEEASVLPNQPLEADEQPRGKFGGFMKVGRAWLLAAQFVVIKGIYTNLKTF